MQYVSIGNVMLWYVTCALHY